MIDTGLRRLIVAFCICGHRWFGPSTEQSASSKSACDVVGSPSRFLIHQRSPGIRNLKLGSHNIDGYYAHQHHHHSPHHYISPAQHDSSLLSPLGCSRNTAHRSITLSVTTQVAVASCQPVGLVSKASLRCDGVSPPRCAGPRIPLWPMPDRPHLPGAICPTRREILWPPMM